MASRYVHHTSPRSWRLPVETPKEGIYAVRRELAYLQDETGYKNRLFGLVDTAFRKSLGFRQVDVVFRPAA